MQFHPVVDQTIRHAPIDSLSIAVYAGFFIFVTIASAVRPGLGVATLLIIQPFAFYRDIGNTTITLPKIALAAVFFALLWRRELFPKSLGTNLRGVWIAILLVALTTMLSIAQAAFHGPAIRESLKWVEYFILFAVVYAAFMADPDVRFYAAVAALVTAVVAVLALSQEILGAPSGLSFNGQHIPRIAGPLEGPNQLAGFLDVSVPLLFALVVSTRGRWYATTLSVAAFADVLTFSRAGLICCAIAIAVLTYALIKSSNIRFALASLAPGVIAGTTVAAFWGWFAHSFAIFRIFLLQTDYAGGVGTRSQLWRAVFVLWKQHPLLGVGAGNFEFEIGKAGIAHVRTHANSLYFQALVEQGILGFISTVWLVYRCIFTFRLPRSLENPLALGALGAGIALALHQTVDLLVFFPKVGGWWICVMALGAGSIALPAKR